MALYTVTSALVLIKDNEGVLRHHYRGAVLDSAKVDPDSLERHLDRGMIKEVEPDDKPVETAAAQPTPTAPVTPGSVERPAQTAVKEAWEKYAVAQGLPEETVKAASKEDLIAALS